MGYSNENFWNERLKKSFDLQGVGNRSFSKRYNQYLYRLQEIATIRLFNKLGIVIQNKEVINIASGVGYFDNYFKQLGAAKVVGTDISEYAVSKLKKIYPQNQYYQFDISKNLPADLENKKFDIVTAYNVLFHIIEDDAFNQSISNIKKLVQDDGYIIITDTLGCFTIHFQKHVKFRSKSFYNKILAEQGLEIVSIRPIYFLFNRSPSYLLFKNKYFEKFFLKPIFYFDMIITKFLKYNSNAKLIIIKAKNY
ncbi:class I SAM-dependent methyltransferase [Patescibacteria group bacterium]|nr:class I SAM-dependent methyltransferase [Patescibacteria group bacterium]